MTFQTCPATRSMPAVRPIMVEAAQADFTARCDLPQDEFYSDAFTPSDGAKLG